MTTPLLWKSLEISNKFCSIVLPYSLPLYWDPATERAVIKKTTKELALPCVYVFLMLAAWLCSSITTLEFLLLRSKNIPITIVFFNLFVLGIVSLCLLLIVVIYPNLEIFLGIYYNALLEFEQRIHRRKLYFVTQNQAINVIVAGRCEHKYHT